MGGNLESVEAIPPNLGRLTVVPPREVWRHEAHDFTPWLLSNVDVLSDVLGMDLALDVAEHPVGGFSLDLMGRDETTGEIVIVENQLEVSDHLHLGQILTYAAGTDPTTIVWVAAAFRPEHRAAIDWLNARTDEDTRFFGVELGVVRIGDSDPAPLFRLGCPAERLGEDRTHGHRAVRDDRKTGLPPRLLVPLDRDAAS